MNGALLCVSLLVYGMAWLAFYGADHRAKPENRHAWERLGAGIAAAGTFGFLLSLDGVFAQVWTDAGEGVGLFALVIVTIAAGAFGWLAIARGFMHHRRSTLALGIVTGGAVALAYGDWKVIRSNTGKYLASAGHHITGAGKAGAVTAHGHHAASGGGWGLFLILLAAVVLGAIIIRRHRRGEVENVGKAAVTRSGPRRAVGSGGRGGRAGTFADPMLAGNGS